VSAPPLDVFSGAVRIAPTDVAKAPHPFPPLGFHVLAAASRRAAFSIASTSVGPIVAVVPEREGAPGVVPRFYWLRDESLARVPRLSAGFPPVRAQGGALRDQMEILEGPGPALWATVKWSGDAPDASYSEVFSYARKSRRWQRVAGANKVGVTYEHPVACGDSLVVVVRGEPSARLAVVGGSRPVPELPRPLAPGVAPVLPSTLFGFASGELVASMPDPGSGDILLLRWAAGQTEPHVQALRNHLSRGMQIAALSPTEIVIYAEPRGGGLYNPGSGQIDTVTPPPAPPHRLVFDDGSWRTDPVAAADPPPGPETLRGTLAPALDVVTSFEAAGQLLVAGTHEGRSYLLASVQPKARTDAVDEGRDPPGRPNARGPVPGSTAPSQGGAPAKPVDWGF
jgi:hypothetical protein